MATSNRLLRAEKKKREALRLARKQDEKILDLHTEKLIHSNPEYMSLEAQEGQVRHQLHCARLSINKKLPNAIKAREELLKKMKKTLADLTANEAHLRKQYENILARKRSIRQDMERKAIEVLGSLQEMGAA